MWDTTHHWSPSRHWATDHHFLDLIQQPVLCPVNNSPIKSICFQFGEKDVVGYHIKGLTEVQIDDISGFSFVYWCRSFCIYWCRCSLAFALFQRVWRDHMGIHMHIGVWQLDGTLGGSLLVSGLLPDTCWSVGFFFFFNQIIFPSYEILHWSFLQYFELEIVQWSGSQKLAVCIISDPVFLILNRILTRNFTSILSTRSK